MRTRRRTARAARATSAAPALGRAPPRAGQPPSLIPRIDADPKACALHCVRHADLQGTAKAWLAGGGCSRHSLLCCVGGGKPPWRRRAPPTAAAPPCNAWGLSRLPRKTRSCNRLPRQPARGLRASFLAQQPRRPQQPPHGSKPGSGSPPGPPAHAYRSGLPRRGNPGRAGRSGLQRAAVLLCGQRAADRGKGWMCQCHWRLGQIGPATLAACTATPTYLLTEHADYIRLSSLCHCWCPHKAGGQAGAGLILGEAGRRRRAGASDNSARPCMSS